MEEKKQKRKRLIWATKKEMNRVTITDRMTDLEFARWVHKVTSKDKRTKEELDRDIEREAGI